jgi:hypothetical protein
MWDSELPLLVRHLIDDYSTPYVYSDARLIDLIVAAAQLIKIEVSFQQDYAVDMDAQTISPDPTEIDPKDDGFITLVSLKAACLLARSEAKTSSGRAIMFREGSTEVDRRGVSKEKMAIADNICKEYQDMKLQYQAGHNIKLRVITTPFRIGYPTTITYPSNL